MSNQTLHQVIYANTTWTFPTNVLSVNYIALGQGGGGGGTAAVGSGGGGAGGQNISGTISGTPGTTVLTIAIGTAGGGGGAGAANGTAGSDTTINSTTVVAKGGAGGLSKANGSTGGAGSTTGGVGGTVNAGGSGANGGAGQGGAGGGAGGSTGAGLAGSGIVGGGYINAWGGNGAAGLSASGNGTAAPTSDTFVTYILAWQGGGGGSGGYNSSGTTSRTGGAGAAGLVVLYWVADSSPYLNENFDGVTPPALPTGWTTAGGSGFACVTSATKAYSGANSLKMSGLSGSWGYAHLTTALDGAFGQVQMEAKFSPSAITNGQTNQGSVYARCLGAASGATAPLSSVELYVDFGGGGAELNAITSAGVRNNLTFLIPASSLFSSSTWYRLILTMQDTPDGVFTIIAGYVQRMSDNAWLLPSNTFQVGSQIAYLIYQSNTNTTPQYNIAWSTGTFGAVGCELASGQIIYCDDAIYSALPISQAAQPASPPAAGTNEVELIPSATTAIDAGLASHGTAHLNQSGFADYYASSATSATYVQLDAGSGNTATPVAMLHAVAYALDTTTVIGYQNDVIGSILDGATSSSGPWTNLGQLATSVFARPNLLTTQRLDYNATPGPFRYFRLRTPLNQCGWSQFRMIVQWASGISWQPCRPTLTPGSGRFAVGQTLTIASTSGTINSVATQIYYTVGFNAPNGAWATSTAYLVNNLVSNGGNVYACTTAGTSLGSGGGPTGTGGSISDNTVVWAYAGLLITTPTNSSTLYTGAITLPTNAPYQCVVQAVAYNSGGTTTTSGVTAGYYTVAKKIVPDRGITGNAIFANTSAAFWQDDWYDSSGNIIDANSGGVIFDSSTSTYNWIGGITNAYKIDGSSTLGFNGYQSALIPNVALDYFNWDYVGQVILAPPTAAWLQNAGYTGSIPYWTRAHFLINPAPLDSNKRYVCWAHLFDSAGCAVCITAPALAGPWQFQYYYRPGSTAGDMNVFYDVVDDGTGHGRNKAWLVFAGSNNGTLDLAQLDPLTDWTSFTGQLQVLNSARSQEAPAMFYENGYYYIINSTTLPYFSTAGGTLEYISATTIAGLGSAVLQNIWFGGVPTSPNANFYVQSTCVFQVPNLTSHGYIFMSDNQTAGGSNLGQTRPAWYPISTTATGNNKNAFVGGAGTLAVHSEINWDTSYLPDPATATTWLWSGS